MDIKRIKGLLNPVRMKIVMILLKEKELTTKEMRERLPSVPQASLYRHVKALLKDNFIEITEKKQVRGSLEKTYQIRQNPFEEMKDVAINNDLETATEYFYTFVMTLLSEFSNYASKESSNMLNDTVGFSTFPIYVSDEENLEFLKELEQLLVKYIKNDDTKERTARKFSYIYLPIDETNNE